MFRRDALESRSVYQEEVEPAIVVVVEKSETTTDFFQEVSLARDAAEDIICLTQTSPIGNVGEIETRRRFGSGS